MNFFYPLKIALFIAVFPIIGLSIRTRYLYELQRDYLGQFFHDQNQVLGSSTDLIALNVNFTKQITTGSPLVFGGASNPNLDNPDAWDLLASVGVTSIRRDFWMELELPKNITLQAYKNNTNNVQDPKNWNWTQSWNNISIVNKTLQNAKSRNIKTIAILTYAPAWLTYSGTEKGVPKDWVVYRDIVKKLYRIHRPYIDMMEIWNEPTYTNFLVLTGSPYKTRGEAYRDIYLNALQAIREVDQEANDGKVVPIIAVAGHTPTDTSVLEGVLSSPTAASQVTAVSYHNYHMDEPSDAAYKAVLQKYGKANLPLYLTEWNLSPDENQVNPYHTSSLAIAYTGKKLIGFLNQGLAGANYFALNQNDPTKLHNYQSAFGFYRLDKNKKAYLLPQGKTWQLLSKSLGLGAGASKIFETYEPENLSMTAFQNSVNQKGIAIANDTDIDNQVSVPLKMLQVGSWDAIQIFVASATEDGKTPCNLDLLNTSTDQSLWLAIPAQSVVGLTITPRQQSLATTLSSLNSSKKSKTCALLK